MFVPLATTFHPLRAHMAAGILEEHGIPAWVKGDVTSSGYGTITTGGCQVMVDEEDAEEAARVLNAPVPPAAETEEGEREAAPERDRLSLGKAVITGLVQGAVYLPLLFAAVWMLHMVMIALLNQRDEYRMTGSVSAPSFAVPAALLNCMVTGAVLGVIIGVVSWLFSNYRRGGMGGTVFVTAVAVFLIAPGPSVALLLGEFSQIFDLLFPLF